MLSFCFIISMSKILEDLAFFKLEELEEVHCNLCGSNKSTLILLENSLPILKCLNCGLVYVSPRPQSKDLERFYDKYFPEESVELWEKQMQHVFRKEGLSWIRKFKDKGRLLDIGCGYGFFLKLMHNNGYQVFGIEPSNKAIKFARDNLSLDVREGCLFDAEFPENFFDIVTFWYVLEHIPNPLEHLLKVNRLLKYEGLLIIRVPNMNINIDRILYRLGPLGRKFFLINPPRHLYDYSPSIIRKMLAKGNFKVIKMINGFPRTAGNILEMARRYAWYFLSQLLFYLTKGKVLVGSSITIYAQK